MVSRVNHLHVHIWLWKLFTVRIVLKSYDENVILQAVYFPRDGVPDCMLLS